MAAADDRVPGAPGRDEGFAQRWSRRKQAARANPAIASEAPSADSPPLPAVEAPPPRVLTDADMPPIESLGEDSDFSGFLSAGVSEALRRQALRRLFTLPGLSERCVLDSEFYDCTRLEPLGNIVTHEMREALEREAERLAEQARAALIEKCEPAPAATAGAPPPPGEAKA